MTMNMKKNAAGFLAALLMGLSLFSFSAKAEGSFTAYGFSTEQIQEYFLSVYDPGGKMSVMHRDDFSMILARPIPPSSVEHLMPRVRVPSRDPRRPLGSYDLVPERVFSAEQRMTVSFRADRDGGIRTLFRLDEFANPGDPYRERQVRSDCQNFLALSRYLQATFTGGWGAGFSLSSRNGHMYIRDVLEGSSAWQAGIRSGDRVRLINRTPADDVAFDYFAKKYQWPPEYGKTFSMELQTLQGEQYHADLASIYIPAQTSRLKQFYGLDSVWEGWSEEEICSRVPRWISPEEKAAAARARKAAQTSGLTFDDQGTVTGVEPGSIGASCGIRPGDVIVEVSLVKFGELGADKVRKSIAERLDKRLTVMLTIKRNGKESIFKLRRP